MGDVDQQKFTVALAAFLKKSGKMKVPDWVDITKTNIAKELAPYDEDWFYTRSASMARHIYIRSPVGVKTVCKIYGVRKNNGSAPSHWRPTMRIGSTPGKLCRLWRDSSWWRRTPTVAEDLPARVVVIWIASPPS